MKNGKSNKNDKKKLRKAKIQNKTSKKGSNSKNSKPLYHSYCKLSPLDNYYHVSSLNHPVSKGFNQLYACTLAL
jgi:hypothetical protein